MDQQSFAICPTRGKKVYYYQLSQQKTKNLTWSFRKPEFRIPWMDKVEESEAVLENEFGQCFGGKSRRNMENLQKLVKMLLWPQTRKEIQIEIEENQGEKENLGLKDEDQKRKFFEQVLQNKMECKEAFHISSF